MRSRLYEDEDEIESSHSPVSDEDDKLLRLIRKRYSYGTTKWDSVRKEGQENVRYVSGDVWTDEDKQARKGRPTMCPDELNQFVNQVVNTARQNPRGVKIDPAGDGATQELAQYRENRIRAIEYACNASQVYIQGLQSAVERNIGFWRISRAYVSDKTNEQEIVVLPVMDPDTILLDPDFKELDGSDIAWAFEIDRMTVEEFEERFPKARKVSFNTDFGDDGSDWFDGESIMVASYWQIKKGGKKGKRERKRSVEQFITNGVEILERGDDQPGPYIPIVPVFGKELWVRKGGKSERVLLSLVSLARDPQKALAYVLSSMIESCGQVSKGSYLGAKGQFDADRGFRTWNQVYQATLEYDPVVDLQTGQALPPPHIERNDPDFQTFSIGADVCRRAIQAAMGIQPLPTAAQRQNQKSGLALEKIQSEQSIGSYHLVDHYSSAIKHSGRIYNAWLSATDMGKIEKPIREADGTHKVVRANTDGPVIENGHEYHFPIADDEGRYQVTVSDGPAEPSQMEDAREFVSKMADSLAGMDFLSPPQKAQIFALNVRLMQLGPLGDQMADIIAPKDDAQKQLGQLHQQMAQQSQQMQEMQTALQKLLLEKQGKVLEMQGKAHLAMLDHVAEMAEADKDRETKIAVAEISTKAQNIRERQQSYDDLQAQFHDQAHDAASQATDQAHEQQMAQVQAQQQAALTAQQGQQQSAQSAQEAQQQQQMQKPGNDPVVDLEGNSI